MNTRRLALLPPVSAAVVLAWAGVASAHIEPDPSQVPAAAPATIEFNVEHGCGDEDTTKLEFQIPSEVTDVQPVEKDGWTASVDGDVVTFEGGPQDAHTGTTFGLTFTAPDAEGTSLRFPIVQTCGSTEVAWIEDSEDAENPAPVVAIGAAGSEPVAGGHDDDEEETTGGHDEGETTATSTSPAISEGSTNADDDSSNAVPIAIGAVVLLALIAGGVYVARSRRSS